MFENFQKKVCRESNAVNELKPFPLNDVTLTNKLTRKLKKFDDFFFNSCLGSGSDVIDFWVKNPTEMYFNALILSN